MTMTIQYREISQVFDAGDTNEVGYEADSECFPCYIITYNQPFKSRFSCYILYFAVLV